MKVDFYCWRCRTEWQAHRPDTFAEVKCLRCGSTSLISLDDQEKDEHITVIDNEADALYAKSHLERWVTLAQTDDLLDEIDDVLAEGSTT